LFCKNGDHLVSSSYSLRFTTLQPIGSPLVLVLSMPLHYEKRLPDLTHGKGTRLKKTHQALQLLFDSDLLSHLLRDLNHISFFTIIS
jgi:hypothetical protein